MLAAYLSYLEIENLMSSNSGGCGSVVVWWCGGVVVQTLVYDGQHT